ncbi:MAG: hypothetical protein HOO96_14180, partial [Polyangiaceae bacterium]|nr:hypothetical protein [Polyangiaceae bacterium]
DGKVWGGDGAAYWKVYKNTGTGFATTATQWTLPALGTTEGYDQIAGYDGNTEWVTLDIDGDGKIDLVNTATLADGKVWGGDGAAYWKVHRAVP